MPYAQSQPVIFHTMTPTEENRLYDLTFKQKATALDLRELKELLRRHGSGIACFIYEPLLQGAGGMHMYEASLLDELLGVAKEMDILLVADEVLTGFGRTGQLFAGNHLRHTADIICLSKGLTGGTMALGATRGQQQAGVEGNWTEYMKAFGGKLFRPDLAPGVDEEPPAPVAPTNEVAGASPTLGKLKITNPLFETIQTTGN